MSYCTKPDLINRFTEAELIQVTDNDNLGVINDTVLNQAISDATAEINGYLTRYSLPLAVIPANLVRLACDITRFYLYETQMIEPISIRYDNAIKYLKAVATGAIPLAPDVAGVSTTAASSSAQFSSSAAVFGRNSNY